MKLKGNKRAAYALINLKQAVKSVAPAAEGACMPPDNADRVVAGARALSPHLGDRMLSERLLGKSVVLRELLPQDLKIELNQFMSVEAPKALDF